MVLIDRYEGGGSTRRSGGVVYAGGGTRAQIAAGVNDDCNNMYQYVSLEANGAVHESTLRRFCDTSPAMFEWLENRVGVNFGGNVGEAEGGEKEPKHPPGYYAHKTSYPPSTATLYWSGNEKAAPFKTQARPTPRGT